MITVFTGFLEVFRDFGLSSSLIHRKEIDNLDKHTIFWATITLGFILTILLVTLSPIIAEFYDEPKLVPITKVLSLTFIFQALGGLQLTLLMKKLEFKKLFIVNSIAVFLAGFIAIYLAYSNYGVWTLVIQQLINVAAASLIVWFMTDYKPALQFSKKKLKLHLDYSLSLVGNNSLNYWSRNADNFLIGKFLGAEPLGFYSRAYSIMMLPISRISGILGSVLFPSFSMIQDDKERIKSIYLKITRTVAFVTFPLMGTLFVVAEPFVRIVFGDHWIPMIDVLKALSIVGALQSIGTFVGTIFLSQGSTKLMFKVNIATNIVYMLAFIIGVQYNITVLAICYLIASLIVIIPQYHIAGKLINCTAFEMINNILPHLLLTIIIIFSIHLFFFLIEVQSLYIVIAVGITQFILLWLVLNYLFNKSSFREMKNLMLSLKKI